MLVVAEDVILTIPFPTMLLMYPPIKRLDRYRCLHEFQRRVPPLLPIVFANVRRHKLLHIPLVILEDRCRCCGLDEARVNDCGHWMAEVAPVLIFFHLPMVALTLVLYRRQLRQIVRAPRRQLRLDVFDEFAGVVGLEEAFAGGGFGGFASGGAAGGVFFVVEGHGGFGEAEDGRWGRWSMVGGAVVVGADPSGRTP